MAEGIQKGKSLTAQTFGHCSNEGGHMNIKAQEYFIQLAKYQNFSKAAKELYISQTALSKIIAGLEKEVGEQLFIRNKNTVSLSTAGMAYLNFAKKTVDLYQKSRQVVKDSLLEKGILRIGLTALNDTLFNAIGILHQRFPHARIELYSDQVSVEAFSSSRLDMVMLPEDEAKDLSCCVIAVRNQLYAVMNVEHRLAGNRVLDFSDLENEDLIFSIEENGRLDTAYEYCVHAGFMPKVSFLYNDSKYQMDLILNSSAIAISFNLFRIFRESMDGLISIPININRPIHDRLVLAYHPENQNPLIGEMIRCVESARINRQKTRYDTLQ